MAVEELGEDDCWEVGIGLGVVVVDSEGGGARVGCRDEGVGLGGVIAKSSGGKVTGGEIYRSKVNRGRPMAEGRSVQEQGQSKSTWRSSWCRKAT